MLKVIDEKIYITRGDDEVLDVSFEKAGSGYEMQPEDVLVLTVRELPDTNSPVLFSSAGVPGGTRIVIRNEDTAALEYGADSADVQLNFADGKRTTVWPNNIEDSGRIKVKNLKNFMICSEVTMI